MGTRRDGGRARGGLALLPAGDAAVPSLKEFAIQILRGALTYRGSGRCGMSPSRCGARQWRSSGATVPARAPAQGGLADPAADHGRCATRQRGADPQLGSGFDPGSPAARTSPQRLLLDIAAGRSGNGWKRSSPSASRGVHRLAAAQLLERHARPAGFAIATAWFPGARARRVFAVGDEAFAEMPAADEVAAGRGDDAPARDAPGGARAGDLQPRPLARPRPAAGRWLARRGRPPTSGLAALSPAAGSGEAG